MSHTKEKELIFSQMSVAEQIDFLTSIQESSTGYYSIIATDLNTNIMAWNKGAMQEYGYNEVEIIGKNLFFLYDLDEVKQEKLQVIFAEVLRIGIWFEELTCIRKNGDRFTAFVTVTLRKNRDGNAVGFTIVSRGLSELQQNLRKLQETEDILQSENKKLEEKRDQAIDANILKSAFLANVSHELRTPLNAIIGFAELMHQGKVGPVSTEHKEYLSDILSNSNQLLSLINDILDLTKIESGNMKFYPEKVFINEVIDETREIFQTILDVKKIQWETYVDPALRDINIDPLKLKQVIYNYVSNAIKFTPPGGRILIAIHSDKRNTFRLEVQDTGIGISKDEINQLFIPFRQLDASSTKKYQGTGLGLSLTKNIVEAQGGHVGITSTVGKGSLFYAILPYSYPQTFLKNNHQIETSLKPPTILVIEEESIERDIIVKALEKVGYVIKTATNITDALKYDFLELDAIILDLFTPDISSWKVLRKLRINKPLQESSALVITVPAEREIGIGFKIHDFLIKPIDPKELLAALKWAGANPHNTKKVLIVDDDAVATKIVTEFLKKSGYHVICKADEQSAFDAVKQEQPDVLILDPFMSKVEGFELLHRFRKTTNSMYTPVIIWTVKQLNEERLHLKKQIQERVIREHEDITESLIAELRRHTHMVVNRE